MSLFTIFLQGRSFKVQVMSFFSDYHSQEMGVPQGSIPSVTLFSVKINSITQCPIPVVEETKPLGVIFDRRISFVPYLKYVKKGLKVLLPNIFV